LARSPQGGAVYRQGTVSNPYPGETYNPHGFSQPHAGGYGDIGYAAEPEQYSGGSPPAVPGKNNRGVALVDGGPVRNNDGVRRLTRPGGRRPASQVQTNVNRYSQSASTLMASPTAQSPASSYGMQLPPGAAPPRPGGGQFQ